MFALEVEQVSKIYANGTQALKSITLNIEEGYFFALLGANGAGKTTLIKIITTLSNKSSGKVKVFGYDLDTQVDLVKMQIGVVPQEFNFSIFEKVIDIVTNQAGFYGIPQLEALNRAEEILKALDLWSKKDQIAKNLSGGMKRRLMIARALIHHPRLLILDEPTAGVDVELRHGMWDYLAKLNKQGTTILLTTHYLEEVEQLCNNAAMINLGEIVAQDSVKNLLKSVKDQTFIIETETLNVKTVKELKKFSSDIKLGDDTIEIDLNEHKTLDELLKILVKNEVAIESLSPKNNRLEKLFLNLLKK